MIDNVATILLELRLRYQSTLTVRVQVVKLLHNFQNNDAGTRIDIGTLSVITGIEAI